MTLKALRVGNNKVIRNDSNKANKKIINLFNKSKRNKSRNLMYKPNIKAIRKSTFLIFNIKKTFNRLKQAFIKALIYLYFDLKYYIWIETYALGYVIDRMLSQLNLNPNKITLYNLNSIKSDFGL